MQSSGNFQATRSSRRRSAPGGVGFPHVTSRECAPPAHTHSCWLQLSFETSKVASSSNSFRPDAVPGDRYDLFNAQKMFCCYNDSDYCQTQCDPKLLKAWQRSTRRTDPGERWSYPQQINNVIQYSHASVTERRVYVFKGNDICPFANVRSDTSSVPQRAQQFPQDLRPGPAGPGRTLPPNLHTESHAEIWSVVHCDYGTRYCCVVRRAAGVGIVTRVNLQKHSSSLRAFRLTIVVKICFSYLISTTLTQNAYKAFTETNIDEVLTLVISVHSSAISRASADAPALINADISFWAHLSAGPAARRSRPPRSKVTARKNIKGTPNAVTGGRRGQRVRRRVHLRRARRCRGAAASTHFTHSAPTREVKWTEPFALYMNNRIIQQTTTLGVSPPKSLKNRPTRFPSARCSEVAFRVTLRLLRQFGVVNLRPTLIVTLTAPVRPDARSGTSMTYVTGKFNL
ncbi:hypothetical protein EVAR_67568_1 [Eumeta japonica]|uniref:Uncharacterized protein n=1 Tax=Eumeta variegata TaxID=151549 RepID=A0A4C1ZFU7_EUMVA|nr:hypothetical protein EVAR_67568_1 [Eumeta japonica]